MAARTKTPPKTPAAARPPFDPPYRPAPPAGGLPEWDELPEDFRLSLLILGRLANTLDGTAKRCKRRACRTAGLCMAGGADDTGPCGGAPGPEVHPMIMGMWFVRSLDIYPLPMHEG